jgi:hypothetical protein
VALAGAVIGAAVMLSMGPPSRAQQNLPAVGITSPAAASGAADTHVALNYALPAGVHLQRNPAVVVIDARGRLFEFLPTHISPGTTTSTGYRDLHTELYPPGVYQIHVQIDYTAPDGTSKAANSPTTTLTVPAR